mmetsp:Transcript_103277/g.205274  ORF Transcript_103277/g.205274 Transcript_103277/m.205274 type:complete len:104 (-) Transcript_103277:17-328(-)
MPEGAEDASATSGDAGTVAEAAQTAPAQMTEEDFIREAQAKARARKKARQKKMQYTFLFKAGSFLFMLTVVMITKQVQKFAASWKSSSNATITEQTGKVGGEL